MENLPFLCLINEAIKEAMDRQECLSYIAEKSGLKNCSPARCGEGFPRFEKKKTSSARVTPWSICVERLLNQENIATTVHAPIVPSDSLLLVADNYKHLACLQNDPGRSSST